MNSVMSSHTQRLAVKLMIAIVIFVIVATSLAAMSRYRETLVITVAQHRTLSDKLGHMRRVIAEEREAIAGFKRLLPPGYGVKSPEWFVYARLDEIKSRMAAQDMTVKAIETKDGVRTAHFSLKIPHPDYSQVLNRLAALETEVFPFTSISSIEISNQSSATFTGLTMTIEGDVIMPGGDKAVSPAAPVLQHQTGGGQGTP